MSFIKILVFFRFILILTLEAQAFSDLSAVNLDYEYRNKQTHFIRPLSLNHDAFRPFLNDLFQLSYLGSFCQSRSDSLSDPFQAIEERTAELKDLASDHLKQLRHLKIGAFQNDLLRPIIASSPISPVRVESSFIRTNPSPLMSQVQMMRQAFVAHRFLEGFQLYGELAPQISILREHISTNPSQESLEIDELWRKIQLQWFDDGILLLPSLNFKKPLRLSQPRGSISGRALRHSINISLIENGELAPQTLVDLVIIDEWAPELALPYFKMVVNPELTILKEYYERQLPTVMSQSFSFHDQIKNYQKAGFSLELSARSLMQRLLETRHASCNTCEPYFLTFLQSLDLSWPRI